MKGTGWRGKREEKNERKRVWGRGGLRVFTLDLGAKCCRREKGKNEEEREKRAKKKGIHGMNG